MWTYIVSTKIFILINIYKIIIYFRIHYEEPYKRIIRFVSNSLFYGLFGAILCQFSKDDGIIPVNKNLWSLSFILGKTFFFWFF